MPTVRPNEEVRSEEKLAEEAKPVEDSKPTEVAKPAKEVPGREPNPNDTWLDRAIDACIDWLVERVRR